MAIESTPAKAPGPIDLTNIIPNMKDGNALITLITVKQILLIHFETYFYWPEKLTE